MLHMILKLSRASIVSCPTRLSSGLRCATHLPSGHSAHLFQTSLQLLDLGVELPTEGVLVLDLPVERAVLLLLALQHLAT